MNYKDGTQVRLGDVVDTGKGMTGVVIAIIDEQLFSEGHSFESWVDLCSGMIIDTVRAGPVHFDFPDEDTRLLRRKTATP